MVGLVRALVSDRETSGRALHLPTIDYHYQHQTTSLNHHVQREIRESCGDCPVPSKGWPYPAYTGRATLCTQPFFLRTSTCYG